MGLFTRGAEIANLKPEEVASLNDRTKAVLAEPGLADVVVEHIAAGGTLTR